MDIFSVLTLVGGLALFLYGMNTMGDGLAKVSGGKLESILAKLTNNPIKAVLLGAGVTAVIQSSSATTVMVVGFVNSGIMKLSQAVGVIMGANIGTTVTSWILSLTGIQSDNFFIQLIKPSSFTPILALIGIIMILSSKNLKKKSIGEILLGFTILMYGMTTMSDAVAPLADVPEFTNILTAFTNPLLGMLAGAALTAIIQSSSASVGILQALCATGMIPVSMAIPIIMGQNIGTCVTAIISSTGASKNAKRAALIHLYFNIIGTVLFMIVFLILYHFADISFFSQIATVADVAIIHSVFNISATIVLLPFGKQLEKLAYMSVRDDKAIEKVDEFKALDERFLSRPGYAIDQCRKLTVNMAELSERTVTEAIGLVINGYDSSKAQEISAMESKVDKYEDELGTYLVKISGSSLSERDSCTVSILLHSIGDFERISDHALNISESATEMNEKQLKFSEKALAELTVFSDAVKDILAETVEVFENADVEKAKNIEPLEEAIDELNNEVKNRHIRRLREGRCTIELGFVLSDISTSFERIADHCSNIALSQIQIRQDEYETHEYVEKLKTKYPEQFAERVNEYKSRYCLPD